MNRTFLITCFSALCASVSAQGLVNFHNSPATLISYNYGSNNRSITGPPGTYYFALLAAPMEASNLTDFAFTGLYATNTTTDGIFGGASEAQVPGILPGQIFQFEVAGWASEAGPTFQKDWFNFPPCGGLGISATGSGIAGGSTTNGTLPALDLFGGSTGIQQGFTIVSILTPPAPTTPPVLFAPTFAAASGFSFSAQLQTNRTYKLQYSTNLVDWITIMPFASCPAIFEYVDTNKAVARFYRITPFNFWHP